MYIKLWNIYIYIFHFHEKRYKYSFRILIDYNRWFIYQYYSQISYKFHNDLSSIKGENSLIKSSNSKNSIEYYVIQSCGVHSFVYLLYQLRNDTQLSNKFK